MNRPLIALACIALFSTPTLAPGQGNSPPGQEVDSFQTLIEGPDLPEYLVVQSFFRRANMLLTHNHSQVYADFLTTLGIEPGSPLEELFIEKTLEAQEILEIPFIDVDLKGEAFEAHQYAMIRKKAALLGVVYRTLLRGMVESGVSAEKIKLYCNDRIRSTLKHWSTETDNSRFLEAVAEFDKQIGPQ